MLHTKTLLTRVRHRLAKVDQELIENSRHQDTSEQVLEQIKQLEKYCQNLRNWRITTG